MFGVDLAQANVPTALMVIVVGSVSVIGLAIVAAVLPLLFTERGAQMTFVIHSSLLLISGVYAPVEVLPALAAGAVAAVADDLRAAQRARGAARRGGWRSRRRRPGDPGGDGRRAGARWTLIFREAERYAKRTGRLKRSG